MFEFIADVQCTSIEGWNVMIKIICFEVLQLTIFNARILVLCIIIPIITNNKANNKRNLINVRAMKHFRKYLICKVSYLKVSDINFSFVNNKILMRDVCYMRNNSAEIIYQKGFKALKLIYVPKMY